MVYRVLQFPVKMKDAGIYTCNMTAIPIGYTAHCNITITIFDGEKVDEKEGEVVVLPG